MLTAGVAKRFQHLRGLVFSPRLRAAVVTMDTDMGASLRDLVRTRTRIMKPSGSYTARSLVETNVYVYCGSPAVFATRSFSLVESSTYAFLDRRRDCSPSIWKPKNTCSDDLKQYVLKRQE